MSELARVTAEIERHVAEAGWDQSPQLYALVETAELIAVQPQLVDALGLVPGATAPGALTPIEQEPLGDAPLDSALARIEWPDEVLGCALAHEVLVLPPGADEEPPADRDLAAWAAEHPDRREVRMVVGVLRDGSSACVLRLRAQSADELDDVVTGDGLAPNLVSALLATLED